MDEVLEPLLIKHQQARVILGYGNTKYWELVKAGEIEVVGEGAMSRATYRSIKDYVDRLRVRCQREGGPQRDGRQ